MAARVLWVRALRGLGWGLAGLLALMLALLAAWVLSNLGDAPATPRPAELARPAPQLSDARNDAWALMGLFAAEDHDPVAAGRTDWQTQIDFAGLGAGQREQPQQQAALAQAQQRGHGKRQARPAGQPWSCGADDSHCTALWLEQAAALTRQREGYAPWGRRCERLIDEGFEFEEPWPPMRSPAEPLGLHIGGAAACAGWLHTGAVLAWAEGRRDEALRQLQRADVLQRGLLAGSQSLTGQVIALRLSRRYHQALADLALRDAALAAALQPLLAAPLPDSLAAARRWVVFESAYSHAGLAVVLNNCADTPASIEVPPLERALARASGWACRQRIGMHPQRTLQQVDRAWLGLWHSLQDGWPAALAYIENAAHDDGTGPRWRNTFGAVVVDVAVPGYRPYLYRHTDALLHAQAVALAVAAQVQRVPAAEREAWSRTQALSPELRQALRWAPDGSVLEVDLGAAAAQAQADRREPIRIAWPR